MLTQKQAFKHIFTSPSSVDKEPKATRSCNARIHGMTRVTLPSIAYVATQVRANPVRQECVLIFFSGPIWSLLFARVLEDGYCNGFRTFL
jgi:hypothetical protein